jgi:hypothetical protein
MNIIITYFIYLLLSAILVFVVGYLFYKSGDAYISFLFPNDLHLSRSLNKLLLIAYYLLNMGFILFFLQKIQSAETINEAIFFIAKHLSDNILTIAVLHYVNLIWLQLLAKKFIIHPKKQSLS